MLALCDCLRDNFSLSGFTGTATELAAAVEKATGKTITPAVLRKKLMKHYGDMLGMGWQCSYRRTRNEKIIEIKQRGTAAADEPYAGNPDTMQSAVGAVGSGRQK